MIISKTYNILGLLASSTDALGNTISYEYDKMGDIVRMADYYLNKLEEYED